MSDDRKPTDEDDEFYDMVDTVFCVAAERGIRTEVLVAAAMNAACFAAHSDDTSRAEFLKMADDAWKASLFQVQQLRAELNIEEGKAAKA